MTETKTSLTSLITNSHFTSTIEIKLRYLNFLYLLYLCRKNHSISTLIKIITKSSLPTIQDISIELLLSENEILFNKNDFSSLSENLTNVTNTQNDSSQNLNNSNNLNYNIISNDLNYVKMINLAIEKKLFPSLSFQEHSAILTELEKNENIIHSNFNRLVLFFRKCVGNVEKNEIKYYCIGDVDRMDEILNGVIYSPEQMVDNVFYYSCEIDCFMECYQQFFEEISRCNVKDKNDQQINDVNRQIKNCGEDYEELKQMEEIEENEQNNNIFNGQNDQSSENNNERNNTLPSEGNKEENRETNENDIKLNEMNKSNNLNISNENEINEDNQMIEENEIIDFMNEEELNEIIDEDDPKQNEFQFNKNENEMQCENKERTQIEIQLGYTPIQFPKSYIRLTHKHSSFDKKSVHFHVEKAGPEFYVNPEEYERLKQKALSDSDNMKKPDKIIDRARHPRYQRCFRMLREMFGNDFLIAFPSEKIVKNIYHSSQLIFDEIKMDGNNDSTHSFDDSRKNPFKSFGSNANASL